MFLIEQHVQASAPALYDAELGQWETYGQLQDGVFRLAAVLDSPSKALAFCFCRNDAASLAWYLAAVQAGHAVALLDAGLAGEFKARLVSLYSPEFILQATASSDSCIAVFDSEYKPVVPVGPRNYFWRRRIPSGQPVHPNLALLLSTSGSTGSPKFVRLTKQNVLSNAKSICEALAIQGEDCAISSLPLHYSYGLSVVNTHLLAGAKLVLTNEGLVSTAFWDIFRKTKCTSFAGVPYSYEILHRLGLESLNVPTLHTMTQAGGKLNNDSIARFHDLMARRNGRFFVMYGQTEATARIAILPAHSLLCKLGSVGLPIPGGSFAIEVDGHLINKSTPGQQGELIYTGPNVMMGYATRREDLALGDMQTGRLYTGDVAYMDEDGFLYITGRMKRDAKLFGLRLNLDEVESMLRAYGPTAVISSDGKLRVFCEYGDEQAFACYRHQLATRLKIHHGAFEFHRVDRLPLNSSGKIDYHALAVRS